MCSFLLLLLLVLLLLLLFSFILLGGGNKRSINYMKHPACHHFCPIQNFCNTMGSPDRQSLRAERSWFCISKSFTDYYRINRPFMSCTSPVTHCICSSKKNVWLCLCADKTAQQTKHCLYTISVKWEYMLMRPTVRRMGCTEERQERKRIGDWKCRRSSGWESKR